MAASKLHFLGITGHTMRGIALAAMKLGYQVTGSDPGAYPPGTDWLDSHGIRWWRDPDPRHLDGVDTVVMSGGTAADDVELAAAHERGIPVKSFAEFVGGLSATKRRIVVAGTHGKTTTTSLITWILESAGRQPDFLIGIQPHNFDTSVRISNSPVMVLEGDEYKASTIDERSKFWYYHPDVLVLTSLEMDHPDLFADIAAYRRGFTELVQDMPEAGRILQWAVSQELEEVVRGAAAAVETYGYGGDWQATEVELAPAGIGFTLHHHKEPVGRFEVPLFGQHNVANATAAIAVALGEGLSVADIQAGCHSFRGAARRFDIVSPADRRITVIDDYAHHPTEIAATIEAAKAHFHRRVIAVVRPHTYSRTRELLREYRQAVTRADLAFVTGIEGAREAQLEKTVSGEDIVRDNGDSVRYEPDRARLVERVTETAQAGDVVLCMTVSGYDGLAAELADRLNR